MKLRIRSSETKETLRVDVPDSASLLHLKTLIAAKLTSSAAAPTISAASIGLSLNRTDELHPADPLAPLLSLGLTSGDLLFLSVAPNRMDAVTQASDPPAETMMEDAIQAVDPNPFQGKPTPEAGSTLGAGEFAQVAAKSPSFPFLLQRVMDAEMATAEGGLGFLAVGVHAAFLDFGFMLADGNKGTPFFGGSPSSNSISLRYTVPDLVDINCAGDAENDDKVAILKFSVIKNFASVYGFVGGDHPTIHHVCLDVERFVPLLLSRLEGDVLEFSRVVKNGLCLPLLIDLCEKNGLPLPPCFSRLPIELKAKILALLPGVDLACAGCVNSELRVLSLEDNLWMQKFEEEFGVLRADEVQTAGRSSYLWNFRRSFWKNKFGMHWQTRRDAKRNRREATSSATFIPLRHRGPYQPRWYPVIGGDFGLYPYAGDNQPNLHPRRRFFSPMCSLGERNYYQA